MKTLTAVMAHHGVEAVCQRHLPYWKAHAEVVFCCPFDGCLRGDWNEPIIMGRLEDVSTHHGPSQNRRLKTYLKVLMSLTSFDQYVIAEYDAIYIGAPIVRNGEVSGNVFHDYTPGSKFVGHTFIHPPWTMDRHTLERLHAAIQLLPDDAEDGMGDRVVGLACDRAGIPYHDFLAAHEGYAQNTIEPKHEAELFAAVKAGARHFHGVKSSWVLNTILDNVQQPIHK
jgi:hypothetical protein